MRCVGMCLVELGWLGLGWGGWVGWVGFELLATEFEILVTQVSQVSKPGEGGK